jgi:dipeptidyl aminopeptidase/acylaminoacyl peptidase
MSVCTISPEPNSQPQVVATETDREFFSHHSPDQRWISVVERPTPRGRDQTASVSVIPVGGGPLIRLTEGTWSDEKPRWSADGRAVYFLSNRSGFLNVWGRRFDPQTGRPEGQVFQVTHFNNLDRGIPTNLAQVETSVSGNRIFLPITDFSSTVWTLDGVDR